jgi:predicted tellurium resistance membrane protein TerC
MDMWMPLPEIDVDVPMSSSSSGGSSRGSARRGAAATTSGASGAGMDRRADAAAAAGGRPGSAPLASSSNAPSSSSAGGGSGVTGDAAPRGHGGRDASLLSLEEQERELQAISTALPRTEARLETLALWVGAAVAFGGGVWHFLGPEKGQEFFAGYLLEQSLSIDNLFVFVLVFNYFKTPPSVQPKVLSYGIATAAVLRLVMILAGTELVEHFEPALLLFAVVLLWSAYGLLVGGDEGEEDLSDNKVGPKRPAGRSCRAGAAAGRLHQAAAPWGESSARRRVRRGVAYLWVAAQHIGLRRGDGRKDCVVAERHCWLCTSTPKAPLAAACFHACQHFCSTRVDPGVPRDPAGITSRARPPCQTATPPPSKPARILWTFAPQIVKLCRKLLPVSDHYDGDKFFTTAPPPSPGAAAVRVATPLLLTLAVIEISDVVFAVDSIPAVFGVTLDPFIVYTSNLFAIMSLRSLYAFVSTVMTEMRFLDKAVALVLAFIGGKMIAEFGGVAVPTDVSLLVVGGVLGGGVAASFALPEAKEEAR